jgi:hypothetical protein
MPHFFQESRTRSYFLAAASLKGPSDSNDEINMYGVAINAKMGNKTIQQKIPKMNSIITVIAIVF